MSARARWVMLVLFASAMGWLEAVCAVYIRTMIGFHTGDPNPPQSVIAAKFVEFPWLLPTEQGREAATIVMLASVALLAASGARARWGAFLIAFGVWDIVYYIGLVVMVRWPTSLASVDLLFLIPPHPWWYQPVWVPVAISMGMIALGSRWFLAGTSARSRG